MKTRIEYLDGHRGLAVLLVIFFHAYTRWPDLVPYGDRYGEFLLFKFGWFGLELFFLVSGFVILMTLEKCSTARIFLYRRWLRLFPAMLVCTAIIFISAPYFYERPAGIPTWESLLPGLTFIEPYWWESVIGHRINPMEEAFWSLYVEFKFYVFSAIVFYWRGRNTLICSLLGVFLIACISKAAGMLALPGLALVDSASRHMSFLFFGWFAAGAAFYAYSQEKSKRWIAIGMFAAILSSVAFGGFEWQKTAAAIGVAAFFAASVAFNTVQIVLRNRFVRFFGFISYPLYLIHENIMLSIIIKLGGEPEALSSALLPLPVIALLAGAAFLIARYIEPAVKVVLIRTVPPSHAAGNATAT